MEASVPEGKTFLHLARALVYEFIGSCIVVTSFNYTQASYMARAFGYFVMWVLAVSVSGAHFNPAVSLAVYIAEGKYGRQIGRLLLYWFVQLCGAFAGCLFVYMIFNMPVNAYFLWPQLQNPDVRIWFFSEKGNIYYAKIIFLETFNTFLFILTYLFVIYKPSLRTVDEIIKGLAMGFTLWVCYFYSAGSGACLNPALAIAQTSY
jgi:glycerol uptake facilitator-like aquaporin